MLWALDEHISIGLLLRKKPFGWFLLAGSGISQLGDENCGRRWLVTLVLVSTVKDGSGGSQHADVDVSTAVDVEVDEEFA